MMDDLCGAFRFVAGVALVLAVASFAMAGLAYLVEFLAVRAGWLGEWFQFFELPLVGAAVLFAASLLFALAAMVAVLAIIVGELLDRILLKIQSRFF